MASSKEFVGIAEGIKSRELSLSSTLESLKSTLSGLRSEKVQLEHQIRSLQAELAAAENEDEPDEALIATLELQLEQAYTDLEDTEQEIVETEIEEEETSLEFERVEEEKQQTLFEIQQRARTVAQSINATSGMFGAYATVGASLSQTFQSAFDALSNAASILGGDVGSAPGGGSGTRGNPSRHGGGGGAANLGRPGPAAAIAGSGRIKNSNGPKGSLQSAQTSTRPATSQILQTSLASATRSKTSAQSASHGVHQAQSYQDQARRTSEKSHMISRQMTTLQQSLADNRKMAIADVHSRSALGKKLQSEQASLKNRKKNIVSSPDKNSGIFNIFRQTRENNRPSIIQGSLNERSDFQKRRSWAEQYRVNVSGMVTGSNVASTNSSTPSKGQIQRVLYKNTEMEIDDGVASLLFGFFTGRQVKATYAGNNVDNSISIKSTDERRKEWLKQLEYKVKPIDFSASDISSSSGQETKGQRVREKGHTAEYERDDDAINVMSSINALRGRCNNEEGDNKDSVSYVKNQILVGRIDECVQAHKWKSKEHIYSLEEDLKAVNPNFYTDTGNRTTDSRWNRNCQRCVMALEARFRGADVKAKERILDGTDTLPIMSHPSGWLSVFDQPNPVNCSGKTGIETGITATYHMKEYGDGARAIVRIQRCDTIQIKNNDGVATNYAVESVNGKTVICDILTRKEIDISNSFPNNDFSEGVELKKVQSTYSPNINETVLVTKKDKKTICVAQSHGGHLFYAIQNNGKTIFCDPQTGKIIDKPENYFFLAKREETFVVRTDNLDFTERIDDCCESNS